MTQIAEREVVFKKHIGAIHINNRLSFLQRKMSNVLLANAIEELKTHAVHEITLAQLSKSVGYDSKDTKLLRNHLTTLATTSIEWNLLDSNDSAEWGIATTISGAKIKNGTVYYSYSELLKEKLCDPAMYARLSLSVQRNFNSGYALALYENCVRYKAIKHTGWWDIMLFRKLMGVKEHEYKDIRDLKKRVINRAVSEINTCSDIYIEPEYRRAKRKIASIRFIIQENKQINLEFFNNQKCEKQELTSEMKERFGFSDADIKAILSKHDLVFVRDCLDYVADKVKNNEIKTSVTGYALSVINKGANIKKPTILSEQAREQAKSKQQATVAAKKKADKEKMREQEIEQAIAELPELEKEKLLAAFVNSIHGNTILMSRYEKNGLKSIPVKKAFFHYYAMAEA